MKLSDVNLRELYRNWKKGLNEYRCYYRSSPFVSLQTYHDFEIHDYKNDCDKRILDKIIEQFREDYFMIVDLDLNQILDLSVELNNNYNIKPILNMNLLFNDYGIIGDDEAVSKLINCSLKLKNIKTSKYIMMIQYDRYDDNIDVKKEYKKLNNQYVNGELDLPEKRFLKELEYKGVTIITKNEIKQDLSDYIKTIENEVETNIIMTRS